MAFFHLQKAPQSEYLVRFDRLMVELKSKESVLINGYAIEATRSSQQMPKAIHGAKIACIDFNLSKFRLQMGV